MSARTHGDVEQELAALRRDVEELRALLQTGARQTTSEDNPTEKLRQSLQEKNVANGLSVMHRVNQVQGTGHSGNASSSVTITESAHLPSDEQLAERWERLSVFTASPLVLRALRRLAEPFFSGEPMQRTKAEIAEALGVGEDEVEAALLPLVGQDILRWGKRASGAEFYEWDGYGMPMVLLIHA